MKFNVKAKTRAALLPCSRYWMAYFLFTIGILGSALAYGICAPLFVLGRLHPKPRALADQVMVWGIDRLMRLQPWFTANVRIDLPERGGLLIVSNHRSHLDTFIFLSRIRGIRILAKQTLFSVPFLGAMMRLSGHIPTIQGRLDSFWKAMEKIREYLRHGERVHVFPEMTRCLAGFKGTNEFSLAPFLIAIETGTPILPVVISGTDDVWPKGRMALRSGAPVSVFSLNRLDPKEFPSAEALRNEARKRINHALGAETRSSPAVATTVPQEESRA